MVIDQRGGYQVLSVSRDRDCRYVCGVCGHEFPLAYDVKNPRGKSNRGQSLMLLHAGNNFRAHLLACRQKACILCDKDNEPSLSSTDGMHYHRGGARCTAFQFQGRVGWPTDDRYHKKTKCKGRSVDA